jgi:hypothetical protein
MTPAGPGGAASSLKRLTVEANPPYTNSIRAIGALSP